MEKIYHYWDIIALVLIIIFLIIIFIRAISKNLGLQKNQNINIYNNSATNIIPVSKKDISDKQELPKHKSQRYAEGSLNFKIEKIKKYNPSFTIKEFINSSKNSFEEIVNNYNKNNLEKIKELLSVEIYEKFNKFLETNPDLKSNFKIEKFLIVDVVDVIFKNSLIFIDVIFVTRQKINNNYYEFREIWTFKQNKKLDDNIWKLCKVSKA